MITTVLAQAAPAAPALDGTRLILAALLGIGVIVVLITRFPVHPFLGLTVGSLVVAAVAGLPLDAAVTSFSNGFGSTAASVGTLIALGANARAGLEDTLYLRKDELSVGNLPLVQRAVQVATSLDRAIADVAEAEQLLNLPILSHTA